MKYEERITHNQAVSKRNDIAFDALPSLDGIKLKRIMFDRSTCKHQGISADKYYLVSAHGRWAIGQFDDIWYGWNFNGLYDAGCQLNGLDIIYETDLPAAPKQAEKYISDEDEDEDED